MLRGRGNGDDCSGRLRLNRVNSIQGGACAAQKGGDPMLAALTGSLAYHPLKDSSPPQDCG